MSRLHSFQLFKDPVTFLARLIFTLLFLSGHFKQQTTDEVFQLSHKRIKSSCLHLFEFRLVLVLVFIKINKTPKMEKESAQIP